jgi:hypothetical protein
MKRKFYLMSALLIGLTALFTSCSDDDDTTVEPIDNTKVVSLTTKNNVKVDQWVYFSFKNNSEVSSVDSTNFQTSLDWDIAFHSRHVRLNGGASGPGTAEALDLGVVDWDSVLTAPTVGYVKDAFVDSILFAGVGEFGPIYIGTYLNPVFETAFTYDITTYPPTYTANKNVYVIKLAEGKFVKIIMTDYYNDMGESGYITFKYKFSKEGSNEF